MDENKPLTTGTTHVLPFDKLSPDDFERLCLWFVQREWQFDRVEHTGALGHDQGRDICAWKNGELWIFQCKRQKEFSKSDIHKEVGKVMSSAATGNPSVLLFLLSCNISKGTRDYIARWCRAFGLRCEVLAGSELDEKIKGYPDIVREFFQIPPRQDTSGSNLVLVDMPVSHQPEDLLRVGRGELVTCAALHPRLRLPYRTDFIGQQTFFPLVDLKFKNSGDDAAYLTRLDIEVLEVSLNDAPILEFYISATPEGDLSIRATNCGWGPALNARIDNLQLDEFRKHLSLSGQDYFWHGTIPAEASINTTIPRGSIRSGSAQPFRGPCGFITYEDSLGVEYGFMFRYTPYPFEDYLIHVAKDGFRVSHEDYARAREPSARYNVLLPIGPSRYVKTFPISHEVAPNATERFQVVIGSEKSAEFRLALRLHYDGGRVVQSSPLSLSVVNPNSLWYYNYLKPSWISQAAALAGGHRNVEMFVRRHFSPGEQGFDEIYLHGEQIIEALPPREGAAKERQKDIESSAWAFNNIAFALIDGDIDFDEGVRMAEKALELLPEDPYIWDTLALGNYKKGNYGKAVDCWENAQRKGLDDEELRESLRMARRAAAREESAGN